MAQRRSGPTRKRRRKKPARWPLVLGGTALGAAVTMGSYSLIMHEPEPKAKHTAATDPGAVETPVARERKPRFDFYTILPEVEVVAPGPDSSETLSRDSTKPSGAYLLQAGSFRRFKDADRMKAELALLGIEADIQTVTIDDGDTWHRIRIGPNKSFRTIDKIRRRLQEHDIDAILLRVRE